MPKPTIDDIRRSNGRALIEKYKATHIASKIGHKSASTLSQVFGPTPTRAPTDKMMRRIEEALGLPSGITDRVQIDAGTADTTETFASALRLVAQVLESEGVTMPVPRFSDLVLWSLQDAKDHGGQPREECIRSVVRLLKP